MVGWLADEVTKGKEGDAQCLNLSFSALHTTL